MNKHIDKYRATNGERLATALGTGGFYYMSPDVIDNPTPHEFYLHEKIWNCYKNEYPFMFKGERFDTTRNETIEGYQLQEVQYHCPINLLRQTYLDKDYNILYTIIHDKALFDPQAEDHIYYTHNDHLGSASWITDNGTKPVQYLHYLPYGQLLANHTYLKYTIFSAKVAN